MVQVYFSLENVQILQTVSPNILLFVDITKYYVYLSISEGVVPKVPLTETCCINPSSTLAHVVGWRSSVCVIISLGPK